MNSRAMILAILALILPTVTCQDTVLTEDSDPEMAVAYRSGDIVIGAVVFACDYWDWSRIPASDTVFVDLFYSRSEGADLRLTDDEIRRVEAASGSLVHEFPVSAARIAIPRGHLQDLGDTQTVNHIRNVPDSGRFDLGVTVVSNGDLSAIRESFLQKGGVIDLDLPGLPGFHGFIPDTGVEAITNLPGVLAVQHDQVACLY